MLHSTRLPPASGPSPRTAADDDDARRDELRDALAELRTSLDVGTTGPGRRGVRLLRRRPQAGDGQGPPVSEAPPTARVVQPAETRAEAAQRAEPVDEPVETRAEPAQRGEPVDEPLRPVDPGDPLRPATPRRLVRRGSAGVAAVVTALVIVVALAVSRGPLTRQEGAAPAPSASPVATGPAPAVTASGVLPTPAASPAAPPPLATRPLPWPGGPVLVPAGLPVAGPGADAPGTELTAAVDPDRQHVDAYERVVFRPGATSVLLAAPSAAGLPAELRQVRPVVEGLQAEIDGRPVAPVAEGRGWR